MSMSITQRTILHFKSQRSDKVYIIEMFRNTHTQLYTLVTSWGRRTNPRLSQQIKHQEVIDTVALDELRRIRKSKVKQGYRDIHESLLISGELEVPGYRIHSNEPGGQPVAQVGFAYVDRLPKERIVEQETVRNIV